MYGVAGRCSRLTNLNSVVIARRMRPLPVGLKSLEEEGKG